MSAAPSRFMLLHQRLLCQPRCPALTAGWRLPAARAPSLQAAPTATGAVDDLARAGAAAALDRVGPVACTPQPKPSTDVAREGAHASGAEHSRRTPRRSIAEAFVCPACGNVSFLLPALWRHLGRCCPDLWSGPEEWLVAGSEPAAVRELLRAAVARETTQRASIVRDPALAPLHPWRCLRHRGYKWH